MASATLGMVMAPAQPTGAVLPQVSGRTGTPTHGVEGVVVGSLSSVVVV